MKQILIQNPLFNKNGNPDITNQYKTKIGNNVKREKKYFTVHLLQTEQFCEYKSDILGC